MVISSVSTSERELADDKDDAEDIQQRHVYLQGSILMGVLAGKGADVNAS